MIFTRSKLNPIIKPDKKSVWQSVMTYNPACLYEDGIYHLFYRAVGRAWVSKIGHAVSRDGEKFLIDKRPLLSPVLDIEKNGIEDPRITKINKTYYLTYVAYDGHSARLCLATSKNLKKWTQHGEMLTNWNFTKASGFIVPWDPAQQMPEAQIHWSKAGGIFPEKINGKFLMLFGDRNIWRAESADGKKWKAINKPFFYPRKKYFDSEIIEMGPPPIKTKKGWLILYHGAENNNSQIIYRLGYILLDLNDPNIILYRTKKPIFEPTGKYSIKTLINILPGGIKKMEKMSKKELDKFINKAEKEHKIPKVIFCNGAVLKNDILRIYYGVGDTVICTAAVNINQLLNLK